MHVVYTCYQAEIAHVEVFKILDHHSDMITGFRQLDDALTGEIKFKNVTFKHPLETTTILLQVI